MDHEVKTLLVEVAQTVLRVLVDCPPAVSTSTVASPIPVVATPVPMPVTLSVGGKVIARTPHYLLRGDAVRLWDGDKFVVGTVVSVCRKAPGKPPRVNVRVQRSSGRGRTYQVEVDKCELVRGVQP